MTRSGRGSISIFKLPPYKTAHICSGGGVVTPNKVEAKFNRPQRTLFDQVIWVQYAALCGADACKAKLRASAWLRVAPHLPSPYGGA